MVSFIISRLKCDLVVELTHVAFTSFTYRRDFIRGGPLNVAECPMPTESMSSLPRLPEESAVYDNSNRKRRKVTDISTIPLGISRANTDSLAAPMPASSHVGYSLSSIGSGLENQRGSWDYLLDRHDENDSEIIEPLAPFVQSTQTATSRAHESTAAPGLQRDFEEQIHIQDGENEKAGETPPNAPPQVRSLSEDQIVDVINESIDEYTTQWHDTILRKQLCKANKMWRAVEAEGRRTQRVAEKARNIRYYEARLNIIGDELLKFSWACVEELRAQCKSLQGSVENLEQERWEHSIYGQPYAPPLIESPRPNIDKASISSGEDRDKEYDEDSPISADYESEGAIEGDQFVIKDPPTESRTIVDLGDGSSETEEEGEEDEEDEENIILLENEEPDRPENASFAAVAKWKLQNLIDKSDRKRLIMKIIQNMSEDERDILRARISVRRQDLLNEIPWCIHMMITGQKKMPGVLPKDHNKVIIWTKLFLSWWLCDNYINKNASTWHLEELEECLNKGCRDPGVFHDWVMKIMGRTFKKGSYNRKRFVVPPTAEIVVIDD
ncbi:hypothetical protein CC78DRAFT_544613 [Lojkania enalia]|uniref:DUF7607 domain-containing protein n=1 Tax=Lojkania enalia TaxID=147567 RepID=A0A9P4KA61_9PLEO|nr:hypothetical protein CC78DRAFT_544613 [Didymosphaeria enalia]